ncbi:putative lipoyltransferase 2, mitochondrial [Musca vetustissima]|uniref:putative lipoyltransferase 2, mitochondrial n=1 Tax=Musca vetustissima TaxID=27455 RepID=UPI002AB6528A|nr:putative lipoyltransferase 2, mitochondrial [Musca vetustissima]
MVKLKPLVNVLNVGRIKYQQGLQLQKFLTNQSNEPFTEFRNYLVLQEFEPVYTIGIRTKGYTQEDEERLRKLGAEFYKTNRGGLITFHGPGQLVAYPLLHLKQFKPSMRWYVANLEQMVIETCKQMGVANATTTEDTGIWVDGERKICAIGVHGSRYVTTHGIGFNCCTDLKWFDHIVPCGIEGKGVTSLSEELKRNVTIEETSEKLIETFGKVFRCDTVEYNKVELEDVLDKARRHS